MDHLDQLERKCGEASVMLDKLGSVGQDGVFIKGEILFNAEECSRACKENLTRQNRELQSLNHTANSKQERLQEIKTKLDEAKLRHAQLLEQVELAKKKHVNQTHNEEALAAKQAAMSKKFTELGEKIQVLEKFHSNGAASKTTTSSNATVVAEGGLESFLRQSELFKRLGLSVSKLPKEKIRVSFHLVDPLDHQRQFSFLVYIVDEQYVVEDVRPALASSNLPEMVRELNANNDFSWFARSMRRKFQDSCRV